MFNLFSKFGGPGNCAPTDELTQFIGKLLTENQGLKNELEGWKIGNKNWRKLYDEKADTVDELVKEVNGLRHLKKENVELMERVNEIDSDVNRDLQDQLFTLKNDYAVLKNRNTELLEKYNGFVTMGGLKYMEAKLQIVQNNYKKCSQERDEFKHQLNAANKEIEALKKKFDDSKFSDDLINHSLDYDVIVLKKINEELRSEINEMSTNWHTEVKALKEENEKLNLQVTALHKIIEGGKSTIDEQKAQIKKLEDDIVDYVSEKTEEQKHPMYPIHWSGYDKNIKEFVESELNSEDPVEGNSYDGTETSYVCNKCGYKVAHDTNYFGGCGFCKEGLMIEKTEEQKHPMYPIHWSVYDKNIKEFVESELNSEDPLDEKQVEKWSTTKVAMQDAVQAKQREVEFDAEELLKRTTEFTESLSKIHPNEFQKEKKWICPCNVYKIERGEK